MIVSVGVPGPSSHHLGFRAQPRRSLVSAKTQVLLCLGVWHRVSEKGATHSGPLGSWPTAGSHWSQPAALSTG